MEDVQPYAVGPVSASVCVVADTPRETVEYEMNKKHPTGLPMGWKISDEATFADGAPHPGPCNTDPDRIHYLLHC